MRQHFFPRVLCTSGKEKEYETCRYKGERRTLNIRVPSQLFLLSQENGLEKHVQQAEISYN